MPLHVTMAIDRGYEMPLGVALLSLAEQHSSAGVACNVTVLCSGLDPQDCRDIEEDVAGRIGIDWVEVGLDRLEGVFFNEVLSQATLFRLLIPELLSRDCERTIYLDADTLVTGALTELWETDLKGAMVGGVRDAGVPFAAGPFGTDWRELGMAPDTPYFNAGVLVIPVDEWRTRGVSGTAIRLLRDRALKWGDQDALNITAQGEWVELPRRWNLQTIDVEERSLSWALWRDDVEAAMTDPAIVHYTGGFKPWADGEDHPFARRWFETQSRSHWAAWQPPTRSTLTRVKGRLTRSARVLRYGTP